MTNGSHIVQDIQKVDGYIALLPQGGNINVPFSGRVASVSVHNTGNDFIEITVNTIPVALGNQIAYIAPGSALTFGDYHEAHITSLDIVDSVLTGNGGGNIVVNSFYY